MTITWANRGKAELVDERQGPDCRQWRAAKMKRSFGMCCESRNGPPGASIHSYLSPCLRLVCSLAHSDSPALSLSSRVCLSLISLSLLLSGSLFFLLSFLSPLTLHSILSSSLLSLSLLSSSLLPSSLSSAPLSELSSHRISPFSSVCKVDCIFTCIFIKSDLEKKAFI